MRNLLSANLHRLKKSRAFWGCEIVSALYALFLGFELYLKKKKKNPGRIEGPLGCRERSSLFPGNMKNLKGKI